MRLAPIVLFAFNRPEHTRWCLESLRQNPLAAESELFIHVDGPKPGAAASVRDKNLAVKRVIREQPWCGRVTYIEPEQNRTMPVAMVATVTELVNRYGRIIVLEDDLVVARGFLKYINEGLELYADRNEVWGVEGYLYPIKHIETDTLFLRFTSTWGWGTWARAWNGFIPSAETLLSQISPTEISQFNIGNSYDFHGMLVKCTTGSWKYWDVRWYASVFVNRGFCLYPRQSMVRNIGHDNSGMHCLADDIYQFQEILDEVRVTEQAVEENVLARKKVIRFLRQKRLLNLLARIKRVLSWRAPNPAGP